MRGPRERVHRREVVVVAVILALDFSPKRLHGKHRLLGLRPAVGEVAAHYLGLLFVPARSDAEQEPAARVHIQSRDLLGQQQRIALRHQTDARSQLHSTCNRGCPAERDERINDVRVHLWDDAVRRTGPRRTRLHRQNGMLGHPQRLETDLLGPLGKCRYINRVVCREGRNTDVHSQRSCIGSYGRTVPILRAVYFPYNLFIGTPADANLNSTWYCGGSKWKYLQAYI